MKIAFDINVFILKIELLITFLSDPRDNEENCV